MLYTDLEMGSFISKETHPEVIFQKYNKILYVVGSLLLKTEVVMTSLNMLAL